MYKCAAYFTFYFIEHFSKEKKRIGFLVGFIVLFFYSVAICAAKILLIANEASYRFYGK